MIIEYWIEYKNGHHGCICCGEFKDMKSFYRFKNQQDYEGRNISKVKVIKEK